MRASQSERLTAIVADECELFHDGDTAYADLDADGHRETWPVRSHGFRRWIRHRYFEAHGGAPSSGALRSTLDTIEAQGLFGAERRQVFQRVGAHDQQVYLDLGNRKWQAVEVDADGWRVLDRPPVRFARAPTMRPLPTPVRGGRIEDLRQYLNVESDEDFALVHGWLLGALRAAGPYPVLVLHGEHGSAKSWAVRILRALIDPDVAPLRSAPRSERDLFVTAGNCHVVALDNLSTISRRLSDALCRLSTGGAFATRQLFTDTSEVVINATRPVILNGIDRIVTRGDLADRAILLDLPVIPDAKRVTEEALWAQFEQDRPGILGALLNAVSTGINALPDISLGRVPRMADFAKWITACEAPKNRRVFLDAYKRNRAEAHWSMLDADPVASVIRQWMADKTSWKGEPTELYEELSRIAARTGMRARGWPANGQALSRQLNRLSSTLRPVGIVVTRERGARRRIRITCGECECGDITSIASTGRDGIDAIDAISY